MMETVVFSSNLLSLEAFILRGLNFRMLKTGTTPETGACSEKEYITVSSLKVPQTHQG